jgi:hypothetical protein
MKEENEIIEVFYGTMWEASLLKSILEDNGILAVMNNSINSHYTYVPNGQVSVLVRNSDADNAKAIVEQFKQNNSEDNAPKD